MPCERVLLRLVRIRLPLVRQITIQAAQVFNELHLFEVGGERIRSGSDGLDGGVACLIRRRARLLSGLPGGLRGITRILRRGPCLFGSGSRSLGGLARRFALLADVIERFAILLLMLASGFGDLPAAFGLAPRRFIRDAAFLS